MISRAIHGGTRPRSVAACSAHSSQEGGRDSHDIDTKDAHAWRATATANANAARRRRRCQAQAAAAHRQARRDGKRGEGAGSRWTSSLRHLDPCAVVFIVSLLSISRLATTCRAFIILPSNRLLYPLPAPSSIRCCRPRPRHGGGKHVRLFQAKENEKNRREAGPSEEQRVELVNRGRQAFAQYFPYKLDEWQLEAGGAIASGHNVIVCAPTGSGKTLVGEMGLLHAVFQLDQRGIYTTPLKALSNQKYSDLIPTFGYARVGLSTGDVSIHKRTAIVTVMTTEVYRNMAWRATGQGGASGADEASVQGGRDEQADRTSSTSDLDDTALVVFDEFHYMGLPGRGGVWEESVITSPPHVQMIALSATLPNAGDLCQWMEAVTQRTTVLVQVSQQRPVPLRYLYATKEGLYPLFRDPDAGPGAPHGLLGLRGDGVDPKADNSNNKKKTKAAGFGDGKRKGDKRTNNNDDSSPPSNEPMPKGLQVNPALRAAAERRMQRVNRSLERQKAQARYGGRTMYDNTNGYKNSNNDNYDDDDLGWFRKTSRSRASSGALSPREERKERERLLKKELRRSVPSLPALISRLSQKSLLPAIIFIFSRAGCDEAARTLYQTMKGPRDPNHLELEEAQEFQDSFREGGAKKQTRQRGGRRPANALVQDASGRTFRPSNSFVSEDVMLSLYEPSDLPSGGSFSDDEFSPFSSENWGFYAAAGLLEKRQVREVAARASRFNDDNPEIAFDDEVIEQFLFGVGAHHAGMLPAHKSFVESLYRNQLMKVVFATETLAAGINMPARTTVICSLAKRGDGSSMNLLETSNLLQMAGRAGRRGMDSDGTCVILATPFETHDDAARILTDPIKPITSQFTPSYALCVNLIARGQGKLDVARQLVGKSFAMWERNRVDQSLSALANETVDDVLQTSAEQRFILKLAETMQLQVDRRSALYDVAKLQKLMKVFDDRDVLKKTSKAYIGAKRVLELEQTTLRCLESELAAIRDLYEDEDIKAVGALVSEDERDILDQIEVQLNRLAMTKKEVSNHPFMTFASIANDIMQRGAPEGISLSRALQQARRESDDTNDSVGLSPDELSQFSKSAIVLQRKARKLAVETDIDRSTVVELTELRETRDDSWEDLVAITRTLLSYGCLSIDQPYTDDLKVEDLTYSITPAGANVAMLGFENALWCVVAIGGAWDVVSASSRLDTYRRKAVEYDRDDMNWYEDEGKDQPESDSKWEQESASKSQQEAETLVQQLRALSSSELAGYVSCLVSESSRSGSGTTVVELFQRLTPPQQRVIQSSLIVMERLMEVQKLYSVDEGTRSCNLDVSNCEVVTAWAGGCTWTEALQISGLPPGDLARTLSRSLDGLRQMGNLPFRPIRRGGYDAASAVTMPQGIHPEIRRLCRDAAQSINRYPVKDALVFVASDEEDDFDQEVLEEAAAVDSASATASELEAPGP